MGEMKTTSKEVIQIRLRAGSGRSWWLGGYPALDQKDTYFTLPGWYPVGCCGYPVAMVTLYMQTLSPDLNGCIGYLNRMARWWWKRGTGAESGCW